MVIKMEDEIGTMNKHFDEGLHTDAPTTEKPTTDAPATESVTTEAPTTEAPAIESSATEAPTTESPKDDKDKLIEELRQKLADKEKEPPKGPKTEAPTTEPPMTDQDFVGDLDVDDVVRDKEGFNKLLNQVYKKAVIDTRKTLGETVLRNIPDIVKNNIVLVSALKEASDKFYSDNEDLKPFKKVVAVVFEETAAANPDKKYDEILKEVETETRKRLNLQKKTITQKKNDPPPKLPHAKGGPKEKGTKPDLSPMEKELDEMSNSIGR